MTLRQRLCGFRGHQSKVLDARDGAGNITHVRLLCRGCGMKTRWLSVETYRDPVKDLVMPRLPHACPDCGSDDMEYRRTARKGRPIAHCRSCKGWFGPRVA